MTSAFDFDAAVIGAGAVGLACGYHLGLAGKSVVVLEGERQRFLSEQWPEIRATILRLGLEDQLLGGGPAVSRRRGA